MFFGMKPPEQMLKNVKVKKEPFIKCSEGKGKCRGQLPKEINGVTKILFVYLDMPEECTLDEYYKAIREKAVYDEGITVTKYTAIIGPDTFCWIE